MSDRTNHGSNIADEIQDGDAYGAMNDLTYADVYNILDQLQTHFMDTKPNDIIVHILSEWMNKLFELDPDIELP